jgi:hypothetical protein
MEMLSHPLLPHPADFLVKDKHMEEQKKKSRSYLDKAKFVYQYPGSLEKYIVVFTKTSSVIPKLTSPSFYQEEGSVVCNKEEDGDAKQQQPMFSESTNYRHDTKQRKRTKRFSKVLKETRKQKKTKWFQIIICVY